MLTSGAVRGAFHLRCALGFGQPEVVVSPQSPLRRSASLLYILPSSVTASESSNSSDHFLSLCPVFEGPLDSISCAARASHPSLSLAIARTFALA